jgi:hypothetical protein
MELSMLAKLAVLLAGYYGMLVVAVKPADLAHGREQVEKFIHDRPDAGRVINRHPALKEQIAILFADDGQGINGHVERVYWENVEPVLSNAEHRMSSDDHPTYVRVSRRPEYSAIDKCSDLVFELHNVRNDQNFKALELRVVRGRISREDFAESLVLSEFEALKKTKEFFHRYPLGDVKPKDDPEYADIMGIPEKYSDYLKRSNSDSFEAYREGYRKQYDEILFHQQPVNALAPRSLLDIPMISKSPPGKK